jgi:phage FluMu gp28-like protein
MPRWKAGCEDGNLGIPRDSSIFSDHRAVRLKRGVAMVEAGNTGDKRARRHGDSAIAHVLAYAASCDAGAITEYAYHPVRREDTRRGRLP